MTTEDVVQDDNGDGNIQCVDHPYKNNAPGGICAFCLQEKLGKLVSSSFPTAVFPSSSSSTSPSFRSAVAGALATATTALAGSSSASTLPVVNQLTQSHNSNNNNQCQFHQSNSKRSRLPFLLPQKKKKNKDLNLNTPASSDQRNIIFKRSKSTATPRRDVHFPGDDYSAHKRGFWPFLYLTKHSSMRKPDTCIKETSYASSSTSSTIGSLAAASTVGSSSSASKVGPSVALLNQRSREKKREEFVAVMEEDESPPQGTYERKVSRSRSVGCGSRSFSGDFFERISTGFGDCTLRRVESQREGKSKAGGGVVRRDGIKERVKCGGIFSGFMITSSSSSSSSSSNWISSSTDDNLTSKAAVAAPPRATVAEQLAHGRSKSWGWAFASPIRALSRPSGKKRGGSNKKATPNIAAIPSLLAVRS